MAAGETGGLSLFGQSQPGSGPDSDEVDIAVDFGADAKRFDA